jgi:hypothetical protein
MLGCTVAVAWARARVPVTQNRVPEWKQPGNRTRWPQCRGTARRPAGRAGPAGQVGCEGSPAGAPEQLEKAWSEEPVPPPPSPRPAPRRGARASCSHVRPSEPCARPDAPVGLGPRQPTLLVTVVPGPAPGRRVRRLETRAALKLTRTRSPNLKPRRCRVHCQWQSDCPTGPSRADRVERQLCQSRCWPECGSSRSMAPQTVITGR